MQGSSALSTIRRTGGDLPRKPRSPLKGLVVAVVAVVLVSTLGYVLATYRNRHHGESIEVAFFTVDGPRTANYYIPTGLKGPAPLVVALHGLYNTWQNIRDDSGLDRLADRHHFVVVYPVGLGSSWDAGTCCDYARDYHVDDVTFVDQVIAGASAFHPIDPDRVHLLGFSSGGMMAYRYACERSERVSSIAVAESTMVTPTCRPTHPVAVYAIEGGLDRRVPLLGCANAQPGTACARVEIGPNLPPVFSTLQRWLVLDKVACPAFVGRPIFTFLPHGRHLFPTVADSGFDGGTAMWAFFSAHTRSHGQVSGCR